MSEEKEFMARALELARRGRGAVEPNPMVGAVIVRDSEIIGEGWHKRFGGPHAEVEAIIAARAAGGDPSGTTMYVTLEPCCHQGKTPPCTQAIIEAGIARVVVAMEDPDPNVAGGGLSALRQAGIEVVTGVMGDDARKLLAAYVKLRTKGRPWVICKWAQSLDGKIATHTGSSKWISGESSRRRVHEIRGLCDGVCVGVGTVLADDPLLTNREKKGSGAFFPAGPTHNIREAYKKAPDPFFSQPIRLILDGNLEISPDCRLMRSIDVGPVIIATRQDAPADALKNLTRAGAEVLTLPAEKKGSGAFFPAGPTHNIQEAHKKAPDPFFSLPALLDELGRREWTYLLVEGGRGVHSSFISQGLADELLVFIAPRIVGGPGSIGPVDWEDIDSIDKAFSLPRPEVEQIDDDVLFRYVLTE